MRFKKSITKIIIENLKSYEEIINEDLKETNTHFNLYINLGGFSLKEQEEGKRDDILIKIERRD